MMQRWSFILIAFPLFFAAEAFGAERVVIGSKSYNEPIILGEMVTHLAKQAGVDAVHRAELGGTQVLYQALLKGDIDLYFDYTGTLSKEIFAGEQIRDDDELRSALAKKGVRMGEPLGFNNTYALGMKEERAAALGIKAISDLRKLAETNVEVKKLKLGVSEEFVQRKDGWPGLQERYRLPFQVTSMDHNLAYQGLETGAIDVTDIYSTDAQVRLYQLRVLEDDLGYFPVYNCVALWRIDLEKRQPKVIEQLRRLEGQIDNKAMTEMNARVQVDRISESRVAAEFLQTKLDIEVSLPPDPWLRKLVNSLARTTAQHLLLVSVSLVAAILIGIPLGILAFRRPRIGQFVLATVGVVQTIPSMAIMMFMVTLLGIGPVPAITAISLYSLLPIVRSTYQGLVDITGNLRESAIVLGLDDYARLRLVELPLASRSIMSGIRTAAVINVGAATIGGLIGAGGYGQPIMTGLRLLDASYLLQGAIPAAVLAIAVDALFGYLERFFVPAGLRLKAGA
jgi:osmoprotectant transport system permease protein